jgi:hypothetical protein
VGKTYKDIYDLLRELEDSVLHRNGDDARYVMALFKELGLMDIADKIQQILGKSNL